MSSSDLAAGTAAHPFLETYLLSLREWLDDEEVTELLINRPGEVWVERLGEMERHEAPVVNDCLLQRLAEQVARITNQGITRERPLLAATLPSGHRVQFVGPSATRGHWALAVRRHRLVDLPLNAYDRGTLQPERVKELPDPVERPIDFLRAAVRMRRTILISGGTSTGKTTFLNALLREVPVEERVIIIEDTPEIRLHADNDLGLVAVKGELGEAIVNMDDLLQAALRLRPDRILLGELRGKEAVSFLRAVNTGHPGSFSTIHANSPQGALEQLALMVMQAGLGLSRTDTMEYARSVIGVIVQLGKQGSDRGIVAIEELNPTPVPTQFTQHNALNIAA